MDKIICGDFDHFPCELLNLKLNKNLTYQNFEGRKYTPIGTFEKKLNFSHRLFNALIFVAKTIVSLGILPLLSSKCRENGSCAFTGKKTLSLCGSAYLFRRINAEKGTVYEQHSLGVLHSTGNKGVEISLKKSFYYFKLAADQGHGESQYRVARAYKEGKGISQSNKLAIQYYELAAAQGNPQPRYELNQLLLETNKT